MRPPRRLRADELKLWAYVAGKVEPLPGRVRPIVPEAPKAPVAPGPDETLPAPRAAPSRPIVPALQPLVPLERRQRQRVRRGQHEPDAAIDLHGMRQAEAHRALMGFILRAHGAGHRLVLVVTGKGLPAHHAVFSEQERGVLRRMVPHWLAEPSMRPFVLGYEPATLRHGGDGALYVRIRQARGGGSA